MQDYCPHWVEEYLAEKPLKCSFQFGKKKKKKESIKLFLKGGGLTGTCSQEEEEQRVGSSDQQLAEFNTSMPTFALCWP